MDPVAPRPITHSIANQSPEAEPIVIVTITSDAVRLDDRELAKLRDSAAPGILDAQLRPTYAYPELLAAFANKPPGRLVIEGQPSVGAIRGVTASAKDGAALTLALAEGRSVALRAAPRGSAPLIRVTRDHVELRDATSVLATADLAQVSTLIEKLADAPTIAVEIDDRRSSQDLLTIADAAARASVRELILAIDHDPCVTPPKGMSCVPGGFAIVGSDDHGPEERPRREIELSTFYIDQHEITIADYDVCHEARACKRRINGHQNIMKPFVGPEQPVVPLDWERAVHYCAWAGKRLPSEWEWEKAARGPEGDLYSWGNDPPTCERAQYRECAPHGCTPYPGKANAWDCNEHDTKPVGTYPAGHYGLHEMAGNGYEWTATVGVEDLSNCGDECSGRDPDGPCDGAYPCGNNSTRVLKGGSWYWPAERLRGAHRRVEKTRSGGHRLSARCATENPFLTAFPSSAIEFPRPTPPDPQPPSAEALAIFQGITQDPIEDKPICSDDVRETWGVQERGGRSETTCRDPFPYLESNEPRAWLWKRYLTNIGGAYLGVGSDQGFSFIAIARSEWAWLMDYDPRVVDHHQRMRAFILEAETPEQFVELWSGADTKRSIEVIERHHANADEHAKLRRGFHVTRERLYEYYREQLADPEGREKGFGWLANPEHYSYIRLLYQQGRIMPIKGDLLGNDSMRTVAEAANALGVSIRVFYTSNAPISWGGHITDAYRANVLGLPFDHRGIVLQTTAKGGFRQTGHWHYNVQWGRHLHDRLGKLGYDEVMTMLFERIPADHGDLTLIGLPSGIAD